MNKSIFVFAGEQSGDAIGSHLVALLKSHNFHCVGVGGQKMQEQGLEVLIPMEKFQVMGFFQVLKNLPRILIQFFRIKHYILKTQPAYVLFIDYPGFSLKLAKSLRQNGYHGKIIQYVCPSIWAWKKERKKILENNFDLLYTLFSFEKELFNDSPLKTIWCGHHFASHHYISHDPTHLIIFPGSRKSVIEQNLPIQIKAAKILSRSFNLPVGISCASRAFYPLIQSLNSEKFTLFTDGTEKDIAKCAIATSGTITLELGLRSIPTVVTYKVRPIDGFIAQKFFKLNLPFYCIVNILLNQEVFPEFIHSTIEPEQIASSLKKILDIPFPFDTFKKQIYNPDHDTLFLEGINSLV